MYVAHYFHARPGKKSFSIFSPGDSLVKEAVSIGGYGGYGLKCLPYFVVASEPSMWPCIVSTASVGLRLPLRTSWKDQARSGAIRK